jgi:hypothetical protein
MQRSYDAPRILRAQTLTVSFKTPWNYLAETTLAVRSTESLSQQCSEWWCLLDKVRTHFDQEASM